MSKWRPSENSCRYIIGDLHGNSEGLNLILDRILPLRTINGVKDVLICLGDYIDRGKSSFEVIQKLIDIKKEFPEQIITLLGNHDQFLLESFNCVKGKEIPYYKQVNAWSNWLSNGGKATLFSYAKQQNPNAESFEIDKLSAQRYFPKEHIEFLQNCLPYYKETINDQEYVFVHGGYDPEDNVEEVEVEELIWDRSLLKRVLKGIYSGEKQNWNQVIINGHNKMSGLGYNLIPIITEKFMMLDCGSPEQLLCYELVSNTAYMAEAGNLRLNKYEIKETTKEILAENKRSE